MAKQKTLENSDSVEDFLHQIENDQKREECFILLKLLHTWTNAPAKMWGSSMIGYGRYHYIYASGHEGECFLTGFAPRKQNITLYIMAGFDGYEMLLQKLGKYTMGKSCLYIKKLSDIDLDVLKELVISSTEHLKHKYPDDQK